MDNPQNPGHLEELLRPGHRRSPLPHSVYREQGSQEVHCDKHGSSDSGTCESSAAP
jgi:hypothetical protein